MASTPNLRIIVDGDHLQVYRRGDRVTGRVILVTTEKEDVRSLTVSFKGRCTTRTSRPFYETGTDADAYQPRREFEETVPLFAFDQKLLSECTLAPKKYCWTFDFKFPELTEPKFPRWHHGPKYHREPHPLPPTFQTQTHVPGGNVIITYFVQVRLERNGYRSPVSIQEPLAYHPTPHDMTLDAKIASRVLYAQTWKPLADGRTAMDKVFRRLSRRACSGTSAPRIVPTFHYPERISPGQHIPLLLSLTNSQDGSITEDPTQKQCMLDSVTVTMTTHTTSVCGQPTSQPEDVMLKHVLCLSKTNLNTPIPFGTRTSLTNNFRLVDDAECVPSFKTYTVTRRYDLTVAVGIKYGDRTFRIRCTTLLDILPRIPQELLPALQEGEDAAVDPLPLYVPRDPSKESAPDYDSLYSLSRVPSGSASSAYTRSGSVSSSVASSAVSTPSTELEQPSFPESSSRTRWSMPL
ncbi:hypothetical protein K458DRAFT_287813 [Lentithecium fluviatile CBS 122367]|uniref:Arrestin-like N-terminal domain-containing protein n=1 Tax=Lentithecium fluviatile CBS 122367 TaxID=1168545 RepID=A0A6G1JM78_9PLEO|nr:hypothetical protein K458DRAFT_287813 [Lentithecium fluviatile CBS 122367]